MHQYEYTPNISKPYRYVINLAQRKLYHDRILNEKHYVYLPYLSLKNVKNSNISIQITGTDTNSARLSLPVRWMWGDIRRDGWSCGRCDPGSCCTDSRCRSGSRRRRATGEMNEGTLIFILFFHYSLSSIILISQTIVRSYHMISLPFPWAQDCWHSLFWAQSPCCR